MQLIQCSSPTSAGVAIFSLSCHHRRIDLLLHVMRRQCCIRQHRAAPAPIATCSVSSRSKYQHQRSIQQIE